MIYYCVVICSSGKLQRDLQAPSNSLTFAQTCPNMLKFAQICSNLLKFGELQRDLQAPSNVQAKSRACSSWLFFLKKKWQVRKIAHKVGCPLKFAGEEPLDARTAASLQKSIETVRFVLSESFLYFGCRATRRTNCCVSLTLCWNGVLYVVWYVLHYIIYFLFFLCPTLYHIYIFFFMWSDMSYFISYIFGRIFSHIFL